MALADLKKSSFDFDNLETVDHRGFSVFVTQTRYGYTANIILMVDAEYSDAHLNMLTENIEADTLTELKALIRDEVKDYPKANQLIAEYQAGEWTTDSQGNKITPEQQVNQIVAEVQEMPEHTVAKVLKMASDFLQIDPSLDPINSHKFVNNDKLINYFSICSKFAIVYKNVITPCLLSFDYQDNFLAREKLTEYYTEIYNLFDTQNETLFQLKVGQLLRCKSDLGLYKLIDRLFIKKDHPILNKENKKEEKENNNIQAKKESIKLLKKVILRYENTLKYIDEQIDFNNPAYTIYLTENNKSYSYSNGLMCKVNGRSHYNFSGDITDCKYFFSYEAAHNFMKASEKSIPDTHQIKVICLSHVARELKANLPRVIKEYKEAINKLN